MGIFSKATNFAVATKLRKAITALIIAVVVTGSAAFALPNCASADDCCDWVFMPGHGLYWYCWCAAPEVPAPAL